MKPEDIETLIRRSLPEADVKVSDPMNDGTHLQALVVCATFATKSKVERHRMVYAALGNAFSGPLHALKMTLRTPQEWKEETRT